MLDLFIVILALGLLVFAAMRGFGVVFMAPMFALLLAALSGMPVMKTWATTFMQGAVGYIQSFFPMFLLGAVLGRVLQSAGAAEAIARWIAQKLGTRWAILAIVTACGVLTYGGVSLFVVIFTIYPIASSLFRAADIPRHLIAGAVALGSFSFTMAAFPGSPQIQNIIPTKYFGTDAMAAPISGLVAGIIMWAIGQWYLEKEAKRLKALGHHYVPGPNDTDVEALSDSLKGLEGATDLPLDRKARALPNVLLSVLPLATVIFLLDVLKIDINWALLAGIALALVLFFPRVKATVAKTLEDGSVEATIAMMNTASVVGFGSAVAAAPGFTTLKDLVLSIPGDPLISLAVAANVLAAVAGSASGGLTIALNALAKKYLELGVNPAAAHRIATISCGALDTMPHNGAVITLFKVVGCTHKEAYRDILWVSIWNQLIALVVAIALVHMGIL